MKKIKTIAAAFREMHRLEKKLIPIEIIVGIVMAVMPFVNIWFTATILDLMAQHADFSVLSAYIIAPLALNTVLFFIKIYFFDIQYMYRESVYHKELQQITNTLFRIEYRKLENTDFKTLIHKHAEAQNRVYSAFVQFAWMLRDFISGGLTVAISVAVIFPLLKIGFTKTGDSFFEKPVFLITLLGVMALMTVVILLIAQKLNRNWYLATDAYSKLDKVFYYFLDLFGNYHTGKEIRLYQEQELIRKEATETLLGEGERVLKNASLKTARASSFIALLGACVGFGVYLFVGVKGFFGLFSIGSFVLYCGAFMQIIQGVMAMAGTFGRTEEMVPVVQYYFDILQTENDMTYGTATLDLNRRLEIEFRDVSFRYPGAARDALQHINLKIHAGDKFAVVGKNGSGKTTFIKLLCRFYDVSAGEILINGLNIKEYSQESLFDFYAVVFQDFHVFSATAAQNVAAEETYASEKLSAALQGAGIQARVAQMPQAENTMLYKDLAEDGMDISGGEAQKLALARALYKDSPIVILDEPTAALDPMAESEIYQRFNAFVDNKTVIYISHRLSSCAFCNRIAVFDNAKLVECGAHGDLLEAGGTYAALWNAQAKYYMESEA